MMPWNWLLLESGNCSERNGAVSTCVHRAVRLCVQLRVARTVTHPDPPPTRKKLQYEHFRQGRLRRLRQKQGQRVAPLRMTPCSFLCAEVLYVGNVQVKPVNRVGPRSRRHEVLETAHDHLHRRGLVGCCVD